MRRHTWFWFWNTSIFGEQIQSISQKILWYIPPVHWASSTFFLLKYFDKRSWHRFRSSCFLCMTDTVELFLFEGVIVFGYIQNFPGSTCTGSTCISFVGIKQVRDNLFNSCPHRQWWFRKYAMFFKVIRILQLSVFSWFYINFNLNIFLLKKSYAAGIHYSNVWVIVNCPPQRVSWWNAVHNDLLINKLLFKKTQILFIIYAESNRSGIYLLKTNNAVAGSTINQIIYDDFFCNWLMIDWIAVSIFHNVCMLVQFLNDICKLMHAVIGSL